MIRSDQVTAGHKLLIRQMGSSFMATCPCLLTRVRSAWVREAIEFRPRWTVPDARAAWAAWHEQQGIVL